MMESSSTHRRRWLMLIIVGPITTRTRTRTATILLFLVQLLLINIASNGVVDAVADFSLDVSTSHNNKLTRIAFGSCHKRKYATGDVWRSIEAQHPDIFLWTGDTIYPPGRGIANLTLLEAEYHQMHVNQSMGYNTFQPPYGIYGVYDDHDYGGNDMGHRMKEKAERKDLFANFLGYPSSSSSSSSSSSPSFLKEREGMYHSIDAGPDLKILFLDTRWFREDYCIPSVASKIPLGAPLSCITRWLTAGLRLDRLFPSCPSFPDDDDDDDDDDVTRSRTMLGEAQWTWLEQELKESQAKVHLIISSVQVLTSSPIIESWGHFPSERHRLLRLLNGVSGTVLLSGDVHWAEFLGVYPTTGRLHTQKSTVFMEVTSSGLTHSCTTPFYGKLCQPLVETFHQHRASVDDVYTDRNFGMIHMDWEDKTLTVNIHSAENGTVVMSTGPVSFQRDILSEAELESVILQHPVMDGHLIGRARNVFLVVVGTVMIMSGLVRWRFFFKTKKNSSSSTKKEKSA